jgi:hypothetical protein
MIGALITLSSEVDATNIGGNLTGEHHWFPDYNPFIIVEDLILKDEATVYIHPGVEVYFNGPFKIDSWGSGRIVAEGSRDRMITFDSNRPSQYDIKFINVGAYGIFRNSTIMNAEQGLRATYHSLIENCNFSQVVTGIVILEDWTTIYGCNIIADDIAIDIEKTYGTIISECYIGTSEYGIVLGSSVNNTIIDKVVIFDSNVTGIDYTSVHSGNIIRDSEISWSRRGIRAGGSSHLKLLRTEITRCGVGIELANINGTGTQTNMINRCRLVECGTGIEFSSIYWTTVTETTFHSNYLAIDGESPGQGVLIWRNNFLWNVKDLDSSPTEQVNWSRDGTGNYWTKYAGSDIDSDGIGDSPFTILDGHLDVYPLMMPVDFEDPTAEPGDIKPIDQHGNLDLDGSKSHDDTFIVNWTWTIDNSEYSFIFYGETVSKGFHTAGTFNVTLWVTDAVGNVSSSTATLEVRDKDPPEFLHVDVPDDANTGDLLIISCMVEDNIELSEVWVIYRFGMGTGVRLTLDRISGSNYTVGVEVPLDSVESFHYSLGAIDVVGNIKNRPYTELKVRDNIPPEIIPDVDELATTGDPLILNCSAVDNIGIRNVTVDYTVDRKVWTTLDLTEEGDLWSLVLIVPHDAIGTIHLVFYVNDIHGNVNESGQIKVRVEDNDSPILLSHALNLEPDEVHKGSTINVTADLQDNIHIDQAFLEYRYYETEWTKAELDRVSDYFEGAIVTSTREGNSLWYRFRIVDNSSNVGVSESFVIVLLSIPPSLSVDMDDPIYEGHLYEILINVDDPDNPINELEWNIISDADWLTFEEEGLRLIGEPSEEDIGPYKINISVDDGEGGHAWIIVVGTVSDFNFPPEVVIMSPEPGARVSSKMIITGRASDDDDNIVTVRIRINGSEWYLTDGTTIWSYTLDTTVLKRGIHTVDVIAFDGNSESDVSTIEIFVENKQDDDSAMNKQVLALITMALLVIISIALLLRKTMKKRKE